MSEHPVPGAGVTGPVGLLDAVTSALRPPTTIRWEEPNAVYVFDPDLTTEEAAAFVDLVAAFRTRDVELTPADYAALKPSLAVLRTFRQQTQAQFMALTATQRDRALFDVVNAQTNVLRALLRD